jgi:hypothetical protein
VTSYSRNPSHVQAGRAYLLSVRDRPDEQLPTYSEFAGAYGGVARAAGPVLNSIARDCTSRGEPDLTVLVVNADNRLPGMVSGLPVSHDDPDSLRRWQAELQRVRTHPWPEHEGV